MSAGEGASRIEELLIHNVAWGDITNRRRFFEDYAAANKFDPLIPNNWYKQTRKNILLYKVCLSLSLPLPIPLPLPLLKSWCREHTAYYTTTKTVFQMPSLICFLTSAWINHNLEVHHVLFCIFFFLKQLFNLIFSSMALNKQ